MIIAMPVDEKKIETTVCISFGRTPYFMFYNTDTDEAEFFDNSAISAQGGAGIKAAQVIVDKKADVLLTPRCGENAAAVLEGTVKIYRTEGNNIKENINLFKEGKLNVLAEIHAGFHNHGGN